MTRADLLRRLASARHVVALASTRGEARAARAACERLERRLAASAEGPAIYVAVIELHPRPGWALVHSARWGQQSWRRARARRAWACANCSGAVAAGDPAWRPAEAQGANRRHRLCDSCVGGAP